MYHYEIIPQYILIAFATVLFAYSIGHTALWLIGYQYTQYAKSVFLKIFSGIIATVTVSAILFAAGNTMYIGIIPLGIVFYMFFKKDFARTKNMSFPYSFKHEWKELLYVGIAIGIFAVFFSFLFGYHHDSFYGIKDYSFYAGIAQSLINTGIEAPAFHCNMPGNTLAASPSFYHYFELWFAGTISFVFNSNIFYTIIYIVQPIFFSLIVLLCYAIFQKLVPHTQFLFLRIIPFFFVIVSSFAELANLFFNSNYFITSALISFYNIKLVLIYICILWFFSNITSKEYIKIFPLFILMFVYPPTLPVLLCGLFVYIVYRSLYYKSLQIRLFSLYAIVGIFFLLFYTLQQNTSVETTYSMQEHIFIKLQNIDYQEIKRLVGNILLYSFRMYGLFVLVILTLFVLIKNKKQVFISLFPFHTWILFLTMLCAGLCAHTLLFEVTDFQQLHQNFFMPFFNILLFLFFLFFIVYKQKFSGIFFVCISLISCVLFLNNYDYFKDKKDVANKYNLLQAEFLDSLFTSVYIKNAQSYKSVFDRNINFTKPYSEITRFSNHYFPICLSVFEIPSVSKKEDLLYGTYAIKSSPFYQFVGDTTGGVNLDSLKIAYIRKFKIDYLFLEQNNPFEKQLKALPVEKRFSFENEEYEIIKFDWGK